MKHMSLSQRIKLTFTCSFVVITLISMLLIYGASKGIEDYIFERQLLVQINQYNQAVASGKEGYLPPSLTVYQDVEDMPEDIRVNVDQTEPGIYELSHPQNLDYHYAIVDTPKLGHQVFLFDVNDVEITEDIEFALFNYIGIGFAALLAAFLVMFQLVLKRTLAPMYQLIAHVKQQTENPEQTVSFHYPDDNELGLLNKAFNDYIHRIEQFILREREFTGFASHELRTPLMVIKGATELLEIQQNENPQLQKPIARIARAITNMEDTTEMLLMLSREQLQLSQPSEKVTKINANEVFNASLESLKIRAEQLQKRVVLSGKFAGNLTIEHTPAGIVITNVLKNAIAHSSSAVIAITLDDSSLTLVNDFNEQIPTASNDSAQQVKEKNYGLGRLIIKRICDQYGWHFSERVSNGQYVVQLIFEHCAH